MNILQLPAQRTPSKEGGGRDEGGAYMTCSESHLCYKVACQVIISSENNKIPSEVHNMLE